MHPIQFSSGDVVVDRRADYARMFAENGDHTAAADLMEQALELCPDWAAGWLNLGEYYQNAGKGSEAIRAFREAGARDPDGAFGIGLKLAILGAETMPEHPSGRYVEELFDSYAERFENALVEKLGYDIPAKLAPIIPRPAAGEKFRNTIDLGCGTGLMGHELRPFSTRLEGFDISANMLTKARQKNLYDHLGKADLSLVSAQSGLFSPDLQEARADLVTAADVMMYLGALDNVFSLVAQLSTPGATFAFSVEEAEIDSGYVLLDSLRYAHSRSYVETELEANGFRISHASKTAIRKDRGKAVPGMLFIAHRTP